MLAMLGNTGVKASGLLNTLYNNEAPKLQNFIEDNSWTEEKLKTKAEKYKHIDHTVLNFINVSNSLKSFSEPSEK